MAGGAHGHRGKRIDAEQFDPEELFIPVERSDELFDPRGLEKPDEPMVTSMVVDGYWPWKIIIGCRRGDQKVVLGGHRRVVAAREANRRLRERGLDPVQVPVMFRRGTEASLWDTIAMDNSGNKAEGELLRAERAQKMSEFGQSNADIARKLQVSPSTVGNWLKLLEAATPVKKAVHAEKITAAAAYQLAKLPYEKQAEALEKVLEAAPTTVAGKKERKAKVADVQAAAGGPVAPSRKFLSAMLGHELDQRTLSTEALSVLRWVVTGEEDAYILGWHEQRRLDTEKRYEK